MSDYDEFDDTDEDDEEDELALEEEDENVTPLAAVCELRDSGTYDVWITLENGDRYYAQAERFNWQGQPLLLGEDGLLKSVNAYAAELEYRIKHLVPLSKARHRQLAKRLAAMIAELDALVPELGNAAGGEAAKNLIWPAMDSLTDLERELHDMHVSDYDDDPPYTLSGLVVLPCRCGLPGCLKPISEDEA